MAYIRCKKCGEIYDYPDSNPPERCMFCTAPFSEEDINNAPKRKTIQKTKTSPANKVIITGIQIPIKDLIVLYFNALIAALPFAVGFLILYLLFSAAGRM